MSRGAWRTNVFAQMLVVFITIMLVTASVIAEQAVFARAALHRATLAASDSATRAEVASLQTQLSAAISACGAPAADGSSACAVLDRPDQNITLQPVPPDRGTFVVHTTIAANFATTTCASGLPGASSSAPATIDADAQNLACSAFVHETRYAAVITTEVRAPDDIAVLQKRSAHVTLRLTRQAPYAFLTGLKEDGGDNPDLGIEGDLGGVTPQTQIIVRYGCSGAQCGHVPGDPATSDGVDGQRRAHFDWTNRNTNGTNWSD